MFRFLRLRLTLLYFAGALALVAAVCAAVYLLLQNHFQTSTDLALTHRAALALREVGEPLPQTLSRGEEEWYAERGTTPPAVSGIPTGAEDEDNDDDGEETPVIPFIPSVTAQFFSEGEDGEDTEDAEEEKDDDDEETLPILTIPTATARIAKEDPDAMESGDDEHPPAVPTIPSASIWHADEPEFDAELSPIALTAIRTDGGVDNLTGGNEYYFNPAGIEAARQNGLDLRTATDSSGRRTRVLSLRLSGVPGYSALQVSRSLDDQDHILADLVRNLLQGGVIFALVLGVVSWWFSGRALRSAQAAWDKQQAFIAHAGHELRTPLTMIRAAAEITQRKLPDGDARRGPVGAIIAEADRMGRLVGDLLLLSRLDARALRMELQPVDLAALLGEVSVSFGRVAGERGVALDLGPVHEKAQADEGRLRQVLLILLDNALRHAPEGSAIEIESAAAGRKVLLTVRDHGAGIPPEDLPHLFDRFFRGRGEAAGSGSGLGLAIARELVEAMRGKIRIASDPGLGTTATVELFAAG